MGTSRRRGTRNREALAVLPVEQVAHGLSPGFVRFLRSLAFIGVHGPPRHRIFLILNAAFRTAIGKAGLVRLQFKFFMADAADFNRECHTRKFYDDSAVPRKWESRPPRARSRPLHPVPG